MAPQAETACGAEMMGIGKARDLETKIAAAGQDSDVILLTLETELALRRAGRRVKGGDKVYALRVLSIAMLFTLLLAALGAMFYLQSQLASRGFARKPATGDPVSANPEPAPSTPDAATARQSAPPTH